jgi:hypothetical protein
MMDRKARRYRASFALPTIGDSQSARAKLFKGYDVLDGIPAAQRVGASLIVNGELREWFAALALQAITYLDGLDGEGAWVRSDHRAASGRRLPCVGGPR